MRASKKEVTTKYFMEGIAFYGFVNSRYFTLHSDWPGLVTNSSPDLRLVDRPASKFVWDAIPTLVFLLTSLFSPLTDLPL